MKLSPIDRDLLALLTFRGDASIREIAEILGVKEHTVRYALNKLMRSKSCYFYPFVNFHRIGLMEFELYIAIKSGGEEARERLVKALCAAPRVKFVGALGGEYQLDVLVLAHGIDDLRDTVDSLSRAAPGIDYQMDLAILGSVTYFAANFLGPRKHVEDSVTFAPVNGTYDGDALDRKIIEGLFNKQYSSLRLLSRDLKVPEQTVGYRLQRLKKEGVILGLGYVVDHVKVGLAMTVILVKAKRPSRRLSEKIIASCRRTDCVCFVVESYGAWDYQIGVMLSEPTRLSAVIDRIRGDTKGEFDRIVPVPAFETLKWNISL